jgi:hypothetical protein
MNSVFDFNRWLLYIGKHWNENKKRYLLSLGAIGGLLVLWYSFLMIVNAKLPITEEIQAITFYVGLFLTGCLYASLIFSETSDGPKAIQYLLLPASALEKLFSGILYAVILFFVSYTIIFYIVDFTMVKLSYSVGSARAVREHLGPIRAESIVNVFFATKGGRENFLLYFLLAYFGIQSIFLLGSIYFVKNTYIKTLIFGLIVFLFLIFFVHKILGSFTPDGGFLKPFTVYRIFDNTKGELSVQLPEWFSMILLFLIKYALAPCLWVVTYFRLKEKEV